jgi:hypothetical protein
MKIHHSLCSLSRKEIENNMDVLAEIVSSAKYICRKCARASKKKKYLCKPTKISTQK